MTDPEDQHDQLIVLDLIDDPVVTDSDTQFAVTAPECDAPWWPRVVGEGVDRLEDATRGLTIELAESFSR